MRPRTLPSPASLLAFLPLLAGCASEEKEEDEELARLPELQRVPTVAVERDAFRFSHPEDWTIDADAPGYDPDGYFVIEGPEGATFAFMLLDESANPIALVDAMLAEHGLEDVTEREFEQWGRYGGYGREVFGLGADGVPAGMRAFAYTSTERSFLIAETYFEHGYARARQGFDAIELSFALTDDRIWPAVSLGSPVAEGDRDERLLVRPAFELRFPSDWRVDADAPGYDPDAFFTLLSPVESAWTVIQLLPPDLDPGALVDDARAGLTDVLAEVESAEPLERWGSLEGRGVELSGVERNLDATLRVFVHGADEATLLVTEFWYDEAYPRVASGFERIAETFAFR